MNVIQLSLLKNSGCGGGCKFCGLSTTYEADRKTVVTESDFQKAYDQASATNSRLELVFQTVGANIIEVMNVLLEMADVIKKNAHIELAINPGICTRSDFYDQIAKLGIKRYRNNLECSRKLFSALVPKRPLAQDEKLKSILLAHDAGLSVDTGWLCGLGETEADIDDILNLMEIASPDSITLNYFDPLESAEVFAHTIPSEQQGLAYIQLLRGRFPDVELTLGGAYKLWLSSNLNSISNIDGLYLGTFLDHGLRSKQVKLETKT
ncbi:radical SAM protein [Pedobacter sp. PAMC26386]|nr:radical SAM protein [Pedobacter sp. PAMC26386]